MPVLKGKKRSIISRFRADKEIEASIVPYLWHLGANADPSIEGKPGTPLNTARNRGYRGVVEMLRAAGAAGWIYICRPQPQPDFIIPFSASNFFSFS